MLRLTLFKYGTQTKRENLQRSFFTLKFMLLYGAELRLSHIKLWCSDMANEENHVTPSHVGYVNKR